MFNLILAILCSTTIAVLMRLFTPRVKNNMAMFTSNYLICIACSVFFMLKENESFTTATGSGLTTALIIGAVNGVMYLLSLALMQLNIRRNGVILASTFMKMGVLVPVLIAIIFFAEKPTLTQLIGFVLALFAIIIINASNKSDTLISNGVGPSVLLLIILLIAGGFTDSLANIFDKLGSAEYKNIFLLCTFVVAILSSTIGILIKKQRFTANDFLCGLCIGIPNYFSARFMLHALSSVPAVVAYPVYNVATILLICAIGAVAFKEKIDVKKGIGIAIIIASIVLTII